jgi:hypothetical protein
MEYDAVVRRRWKDAQVDRLASMKTDSRKGDGRCQCVLERQNCLLGTPRDAWYLIELQTASQSQVSGGMPSLFNRLAPGLIRSGIRRCPGLATLAGRTCSRSATVGERAHKRNAARLPKKGTSKLKASARTKVLQEAARSKPKARTTESTIAASGAARTSAGIPSASTGARRLSGTEILTPGVFRSFATEASQVMRTARFTAFFGRQLP